jgi:8-oxo-dGTP pyrophosphatase MutT (NUDIX family)/GNAT superfamily N-acetyltransferase
MTEYISSLRKILGHAPILQCGASVILINPNGELLLQKRRDNGCWGFHGGSVELDEIVEETAKRELFEETGLTAVKLELFGVLSGPELHYVYPNGDAVSNVDIVYLCREYSGRLKPNISEVIEFQFFHPNEIPENISPPQQKPLRAYLESLKTGATINISIAPYDNIYHDDMLFCYLAAKDAIGNFAPDLQWSKPTLKDDLLDIQKSYFECGDVFYLAIDERDRVAGMIGTQTVSPTDLWLKRLFIKPELKGKGIGSKLLTSVEQFAAGKGITTIHTRFAKWYREAAIFYPAKGFIEVDSDDYLLHMIKRLK